jgi:hypothetical protein
VQSIGKKIQIKKRRSMGWQTGFKSDFHCPQTKPGYGQIFVT